MSGNGNGNGVYGPPAPASAPNGRRGIEQLVLPDELVTGEAVVLDLRPASFATRGLAILLDLIVLTISLIALLWVTTAFVNGLDAAAAAAIGLVESLFVLVGVPALVETLSRGRSLGKLAAGLRVVRDDAGPIRFRQAFIRALLMLLEIYPTLGSIALITSLANQRGKRVGDLLAGTMVIRERGGGPRLQQPMMPPELAPWAVAADIGRIPDQLALATRQLIGRADSMHPASRQRLATALATEVARYVAPPPPAGVYPERFLAAVLAERSRRDSERLLRQAQQRQARDEGRRQASPLSPLSTRLIGD